MTFIDEEKAKQCFSAIGGFCTSYSRPTFFHLFLSSLIRKDGLRYNDLQHKFHSRQNWWTVASN